MRIDNPSPDPSPQATTPGLHLGFEADGRRIAYAYIRKNASSAFKRFIVERSPHRDRAGDFATPIDFLHHFHAVPADALAGFDHAIAVLRDPAERLASIYKNKFVQQTGNAGIFANYAALTGEDPQEARFTDLVETCLAQPFALLDPHLHPQSAALGGGPYTDLIPVDALHGRMAAIVGRAAADAFFHQPVNSSSAAPPLVVEAPHRLPARTLHARFRETGRLPAMQALLAGDLPRQIRRHYRRDAQLHAAVADDGLLAAPYRFPAW